MLFNLSFRNIKKSIKDYSIYFMTLVFAVAIFYIFNSIDAQESMMILTKNKHEMLQALIELLGYVSVFVSFILGFLIIYANNFLIRRRKKEIGLYQTLGMSKSKVSLVLVIETIMVGFISLIVGLGIGVLLSQLLSIFTASLFEADLSNFKFIFSSAALIKTIIYFGVIYLLVMLFNIITLSRYKLIDLINANRKNEKVKIKNSILTLIIFILACLTLGYAYKLLFDGALFMMNNKTLTMILAGILGTFLLFLSLSGFLLKIFSMCKKVYFKGLNMFVLKQVNNKINTTVVSTTIISMMLLLTIGILSGSLSMANAFNSSLKENNLTDFTVDVGYYYDFTEKKPSNIEYSDQMNNLLNDSKYKELVKEDYKYNVYVNNSVIIDNFMTKKAKKEASNLFGNNTNYDSLVAIILESDYNNIMKLYDRKDLIIDLANDEYIMTVNIDTIKDYYQDALNHNVKINIAGKTLKLKNNKPVSIAFANYNGNGNDGVIIVDDSMAKYLSIYKTTIIGNYKNANDDVDMKFADLTEKYMMIDYSNITYARTKLSMEAASVGVKVILTFVGLYLGIIFAITSATVLAIGQLSESSDNKSRYKVLRQLGADNKMINRALFIQIAVAFLFPLVVALVHAYFGLGKLNEAIKLLGNLDLASNIFITALFITIVYGGYFLLTYICSKNIINND